LLTFVIRFTVYLAPYQVSLLSVYVVTFFVLLWSYILVGRTFFPVFLYSPTCISY